jgi:ArsR family transcriptional regulator
MTCENLKEEHVQKLRKLNDELPSFGDFEDYSDKLKALSDPTRLKILYLLSEGSCCTCSIQEILDKPQSNVSHHLKILKNAGSIDSKKDGIWVYHKVKDPEIIDLLDNLNHLITN